MIYNILSLSDKNKWNEYIQKFSETQKDIYYTPEYYQLYENLGDGIAKCFIYEDGENFIIYPFLLNCVNHLGYSLDEQYFDIQGAYGYNGLISTTNSDHFINHFYKCFSQFCKESKIIAEFTRFHPLLNNVEYSKNYLDISFDRKTVFLDLYNNYENIFANFQTTTRKQIKRAKKKYNLEVKIFENDITIIDVFCNIYNEAMLRVKSIPYLFFNTIYFKSLIESTQNACFIAYHEEKPIASIIVLYNKYYINGHLGGSLTNYLHMSPFSFLYAEMIKYGQSKGCKFLNVGGGSTSNPNDSLLTFKMNFSKTTADFFIGKRIYNQSIYEEVIKQWECKNSEKIDMYKARILKYRY